MRLGRRIATQSLSPKQTDSRLISEIYWTCPILTLTKGRSCKVQMCSNSIAGATFLVKALDEKGTAVVDDEHLTINNIMRERREKERKENMDLQRNEEQRNR